MTRLRARARDAYARQLDRLGPAWANTANSVRAGYENVWISAALDAIEVLVRACPDAEGDEAEEGGGA